MSGIGGVRAFAAGEVAEGVLQEMAERLRHRGPDETASWAGPDVAMAVTRLAVVDPERSQQPMQSVDGRWVVALDGSIHNHASLRAHLDYPFRTDGDTEVVLAGLALEGIAFVERLQGQFAIVAHDLRTQTTHLVRDRLGTRPMHYRHVPGGIAFASEVKALLVLAPPEVDHRSLDAYLATRSVPAPDTLFEGIKKVRPGHRVELMPGGRLDEVAWWTLPEADPEGTWADADAVEAVGDGVREAVRSALVADVPVGSYLSGRLDSSLIVAHVQALRGEAPVHTFSAGFVGQPQDELTWARRVSAVLGTEHHEVLLRAGDFEDLWSTLTWHRDAPLTDPADVAVHGLARAAREHVRVVLSGGGGDELFGGRPQHRLARLAERASVLPARLRSGLAGPVERRLGAPFTAAERQQLLGGSPPADRRAAAAVGVDAIDRMLRHDVRHELPDHLLERGDRMSMAASLELRPVLLDHRLVELAFRLPTSVKVRHGTTKWVLKEAARPYLPDEVIDRRQSPGRAPLDAWFRGGLREAARDRLAPGSWVGQTFDRAMVRDLVERHERGAAEEGRLWTLLSLEMWHERFFGAAPTPPRPRQGARSGVPSGA